MTKNPKTVTKDMISAEALRIMHDKKITNIQEILPLLEQIVQMGKKLLIIAEDVDGEALADDFMADVDTDAAFEKDTEVIENGVFYESKHRSAPYFDVQIDGIELLNAKF